VNSNISNELMNKLKQCELSMLKCFISICQKLNLKYFLVGGTLLGAVRHQGFIPWDDDIDVGMLRKDYEVFLKEAGKLLPEYYFLQTSNTDPEFPHNFAKIRDSRTTFIETTTKKYNINHGVFIDIFPFDFYPDGRATANVLEFKKKFLKSRIDLGFFFDTPVVHSKLGNIMIALAKVRYPSIKKAVVARGKLFQSVKKGNRITNYCGIWGQREIVPKEWLEETCDLQFEDIVASGPKYYHEYLRNVYGNYMELPPVEMRVGHHYTEVIDLNYPFTHYLDKLEKRQIQRNN
jgi:lipopolysaccharide cholinephosphotransferase